MDKLLLPFSRDLKYLVTGTLLGSAGGVMLYADMISYQIYIVIANAVCAYLLTMIAGFMHGWIRKCYISLVATIYLLLFFLEIFTVSAFGLVFDKSVVLLIMGTNLQEAGEFFRTFVGLKECLLFLLVVLLIVFIYQCVNKIGGGIAKRRSLGRRVYEFTMLAFMAVGLVLTVRNYHVLRELTVPGKIYWVTQMPELPGADGFVTDPKLSQYDEARPAKVMIIFGESFVRDHSSMFGYDKPTNPLLEGLQADSLLFAFDNVESYGLWTTQAFTNMMSTFRDDGSDFSKHDNVVQVLRKLGYKTYWLSNQNKDGVQDLVITRYAQQCDTMAFTHLFGSYHYKTSKLTLDDSLLPILDATLANDTTRQAFFVHLTGSHFDYSLRYPEGFGKFKPADYPGRTEFQAKILSEYDNSLLFNDYVVSELLERLAGNDAVAIYVPDHGQDMFVSNPTYHTHGKPNDPVSVHAARQIPVMVYMSRSYLDEHPELAERVRRAAHNKWNNTDLVYSVVDLLGYRFDSDSTNAMSLFRDPSVPYPDPLKGEGGEAVHIGAEAGDAACAYGSDE